MQYLVTKRFRAKAICGQVNLCLGSKCYSNGNLIYDKIGRPICTTTSENAHQFFTFNDDGNAKDRRKLINQITGLLAETKTGPIRWQRVWDDKLVCQRYKREEFADYWLWNHKFYSASLSDLTYIKNLILEV